MWWSWDRLRPLTFYICIFSTQLTTFSKPPPFYTSHFKALFPSILIVSFKSFWLLLLVEFTSSPSSLYSDSWAISFRSSLSYISQICSQSSILQAVTSRCYPRSQPTTFPVQLNFTLQAYASRANSDEGTGRCSQHWRSMKPCLGV